MTITSLYPVLMSADVPAASAFYQRELGLEVSFESDWYVSMRIGDFELAILRHDHQTIPAGHGALPRGLLINVEVADADAIYARMITDAGRSPVLALRDEPFGQRHFIMEGPDGVLLDVIQPIDPAPEFREAFGLA